MKPIRPLKMPRDRSYEREILHVRPYLVTEAPAPHESDKASRKLAALAPNRPST
jgi:hypothetical protein